MWPDFVNFWDYVLSLNFLITMGLVLAFFLPVLLSVWLTWQSNDDESFEAGPDGA